MATLYPVSCVAENAKRAEWTRNHEPSNGKWDIAHSEKKRNQPTMAKCIEKVEKGSFRSRWITHYVFQMFSIKDWRTFSRWTHELTLPLCFGSGVPLGFNFFHVKTLRSREYNVSSIMLSKTCILSLTTWATLVFGFTAVGASPLVSILIHFPERRK